MGRACGSRGPAIRPALRLRADWLYTGEGEILPFGALLIDQLGRILAAGTDQSVTASPDIRNEEFPGCVLIPGLVNAHTHLELTGLAGRAEETEFPDWIRSIIRLKSGVDAAGFLSAARAGLDQCYAAGVTTVADTGDSGAPFEALLERGGSGIAYLEVFGPDPAVAEQQFAAFRDRILQLKTRQTERVRLGVSPHAPYSVSGPLYQKVARFAAEEELPLAVHIAESSAESALLESAGGPFAEQWKQRGIPPPPLPGRSPLAWLEEHGVLSPRTLCIHVIRATKEDIRRLARHHSAVAHCPRSNRRHRHGDAPLRDLLDGGLRVGAGTDSAASVNPPDLLAEARAARALATLSAAESLDLVMLGAATALDLNREAGSLAAGKWADCAVVRLPGGCGRDMVPEAILAGAVSDVVATFLGGRQVHHRRS